MSIVQRVVSRQRKITKSIRWRAFSSLEQYQQIVFVVGCQRSGTTLVMNCFDNDARAIVFRDDSVLSGHQGNRLRIKPYAEVKAILAKTRCPLVVAKPLLDSQRTDELLDDYPRSKAIWMFRHFRGVVGSNLRKFKGQVENIRRVLEMPEDWRGERVSDETRDFIRPFVNPEMRREDAAALVWIARNNLFFEQSLQNCDRTFLLPYEDLVKSSRDTVKGIYRFLGISQPTKPVDRSIHQRALGRGQDLDIHPEILARCENIQQKLVECAAQKTRAVRIEEEQV
ncbi:hypothetical protein Mal15_36820 [Stieleria maiorica]|uniref:Sulfotransferase n=1 Tax=Stieleria maiorica TaxID=2795974 RepID=A0A5B9MHU3_9BACT|nr:sulfotransferase [Stieleria maiorica]QEF99616.1 hypothetical protein Mal15_36820 [Stieleria maiorica]